MSGSEGSIPPRRYGDRRNRYQMLASWYGKNFADTEIAAHTAQPRKIDAVLDDILAKVRRRDNGLLLQIKSRWQELIGSGFARFVEPAALKEGVLILQVRHSALIMELQPTLDLVKTRIDDKIGAGICKEIRLTLA